MTQPSDEVSKPEGQLTDAFNPDHVLVLAAILFAITSLIVAAWISSGVLNYIRTAISLWLFSVFLVPVLFSLGAFRVVVLSLQSEYADIGEAAIFSVIFLHVSLLVFFVSWWIAPSALEEIVVGVIRAVFIT